MHALKQFEATEANLGKAERLLAETLALIPSGIVFGSNSQYDEKCLAIDELAQHLPAIDGWKPKLGMLDLDGIAHWRLDAAESGEPTAEIGLYRAIEEPGRELAEYRFRFNRKRRALIRDAALDLMSDVDRDLLTLREELRDRQENERAAESAWNGLRSHIAEIETLLGSSLKRPQGWDALRRHMSFAMVVDFNDIANTDWPAVKKGLAKTLYGEDEPLPVETGDLADLVASKPRGPVSAKLRWSNLTAEDFERLIFSLISSENGYENPTWLMHTNAPDRGRDLSVFRVSTDALSGTSRIRIIIQCRHRQSDSVSPADVATLREQMRLWGEPRVDVLVIATSGRFTADAVSLIERHNTSDEALRIEMWPNSHLERLLASRPALIAEFSLR
jgi:hypothetical protein